MSLFEDTNPRELKELLLQIHSREAALPDFSTRLRLGPERYAGVDRLHRVELPGRQFAQDSQHAEPLRMS